jgi:prepilin-type processing-associated H-X9-DG protein
MDYAGLAAAPVDKDYPYTELQTLLSNNLGCRLGHSFWGTSQYGNDFNPQPRSELRGRTYTGFSGLLVRSSYLVAHGSRDQSTAKMLGYDKIVRVGKVKDGLSKTALVTEKRLQYGGTQNSPGSDNLPNDDLCWSDGYDLDNMICSICPPEGDSPQQTAVGGQYSNTYTAGSAHDGGMNAVFADGSVRFLTYEISTEMLNRVANRKDSESVQLD